MLLVGAFQLVGGARDGRRRCRAADQAAEDRVVSRSARTSKVLTEDGRHVEPGSDEVGVLALGGRNPLGYYKDSEKSERTFKLIDGVRYSIPGDFAQVDADGTIHLLGRGSVCINSGGEKIFPEEVEEALKTHESVRDAVVVGIPHPTYGRKQIVAVVEPADGVVRSVRVRDGADRPREGPARVVQGTSTGAVRAHDPGGRPTARSITSGTGRRRSRRSGSGGGRPEAFVHALGVTDVHLPGRCHERRG